MTCTLTLRYRADNEERTLSDTENDDLALRVEDKDGRRRVTLSAKRDLDLLSYREEDHDLTAGEGDPENDRYFLNGYQSWTDTKETYLFEKERDVTRLPKRLVDRFAFDRYGDAAFYHYNKNTLHGYDLFYVRGKRACFFANLNGDDAFLVFAVDRKTGRVTVSSDVFGARVKEGGQYVLCDYLYAQNYEEGLAAFYRAFRARKAEKLLGYTSWYNYYQNVSEEILSRDLDALDERFDLFQIDDGYETFVGDWLDVNPVKFPHGLSGFVERAHDRGIRAGIWLAPFVAERKSKLFCERPDLFRRDERGEYVLCGSNWSGFYALDLDNHEARDYIRRCLSHYAGMGFDFFKLDFLYAACLPDYPGRTRARAASDAFAFLRECLGDKLILGCGAPLFPAAGKFDYMRVGPDVSLKFDDAWFMRFMHRERISTKVTLQNTVYRWIFDGALFGCDPDVFLLRDENLSLSPARREALLTLNALFGRLLMTSDNIADYDFETRETLARALTLFRQAKVKEYDRDGDLIRIAYTQNGQESTVVYDTRKGHLV